MSRPVVTTSPADPVELERFRQALTVAADRILARHGVDPDPILDWDLPDIDDLADYVTRKLDGGVVSAVKIAEGADAHTPDILAARLVHGGFVDEGRRLLDRYYAETPFGIWGSS
jgi:hypothetical protein